MKDLDLKTADVVLRYLSQCETRDQLELIADCALRMAGRDGLPAVPETRNLWIGCRGMPHLERVMIAVSKRWPSCQGDVSHER